MDPITIPIPNEMCARTGISGRFINASEIGVFPSQLVKPFGENTAPLYVSDTQASIFHVRREIVLFHPIIRQLVNESSGVFIQLQLEVADEHRRLLLNATHYSKLYRALIRATLENIQENMQLCEEKQHLLNFITIFYSIECIWHLCEILFINSSPDQYLMTDLLKWVRFHIPKYERRAAQLIGDKSGVGMELVSDYWETVIGCVLQARVEEACILLEMHSNANTQPFIAALSVMRGMPLFNREQLQSVAQFRLSRKHWMLRTQAKLDENVWDAEDNLRFIVKLLVGEEMAWQAAQAQCNEWYELLAAWLFYTDPTLKNSELGHYAELCIARMKCQMKKIDQILLSIMSFSCEFIKEIQAVGDNVWFASHLADLLYHSGHFKSIEMEHGAAAKFRESVLIDYGTMLMSHHSLWQVGLNYLDYCPNHGIAAIKLLLPRIATTERRTVLVMREAAKRSLWHLEHSVAKVQSLFYLHNGSYGNAIVWAIKAMDNDCVTHIVNKLLKHYVATCELLHPTLMVDLAFSFMNNDSLIFATKYYQFREEYKSLQYQNAMDSLVALIASKYTPKFFWEVLFMDALNLLENSDITWNYMNIMIISREFEDNFKFIACPKKIKTFRMVLARTLGTVFTKNTALSRM